MRPEFCEFILSFIAYAPRRPDISPSFPLCEDSLRPSHRAGLGTPRPWQHRYHEFDTDLPIHLDTLLDSNLALRFHRC